MRTVHTSNASFAGLGAKPVVPNTPDDHAIAVALQQVYINNTLMMATVNIFNATIILVSFYTVAYRPLLFGWYLLLSVFTVMGVLLWRSARKRQAPTHSSGRFLRKAEYSALILGYFWGLPNIIFSNGDTALSMFLLLVSASTAAGYVSMIPAAPRITARFVGAAAIPIIAYAVVALGQFGPAVAILAVVLTFALVSGSIRSYVQLADFITARTVAQSARANLFDAIEAVNDAFAIYDSSGDVTMSNSRYRKLFPDGVALEKGVDGSVQRIADDTWVMRSIKPIADGRFVSIHNDVSSLKLREHQLIAARREAEDANAAKARFMSTMSHELRTPLNIINGFSKIMSSQSKVPINPQHMREYADSIHDAGEHLLQVINDIIEFSQVGSDRFIHDPQALDVRESLARAVTLSAKFNGLKDVSGFEVSVSPRLGEVIVDDAAFRRVVMSLLTNAIKFGGAPARLTVRGYLRGDGSPVIAIRDYGPGIPAKDLERVFDPFYQCERDRGGEFSGTGLGLPIARELMRFHGGDVELVSETGVGTTASIVLPPEAHIAPKLDAVRPARLGEVA